METLINDIETIGKPRLTIRHTRTLPLGTFSLISVSANRLRPNANLDSVEYWEDVEFSLSELTEPLAQVYCEYILGNGIAQGHTKIHVKEVGVVLKTQARKDVDLNLQELEGQHIRSNGCRGLWSFVNLRSVKTAADVDEAFRAVVEKLLPLCDGTIRCDNVVQHTYEVTA